MATYILLKILTSNVYIFFVSLCFFLRIQSTFLNIEELQKSKYGVEISAKPVLLNNQDKEGSIMRITSKHGQQYQCVLPIVHFETKELSAINVTTEEINKLLQPLNNTCLFQLNGWWSYSVCIGRSISQYHDEGGHQVKDNISLGHFSGSTDWSNVTITEETKANNKYHSQFYNNGTVCDLTGEPRKTEVRFFCGLQTADLISRIDESSTCNYVINIHTHKLCNHSLFRPPAKPTKHSIICSPALKEDQYKKYTEVQNRKSDDSKKRHITLWFIVWMTCSKHVGMLWELGKACETRAKEKTKEDEQPVSSSDETDEHNKNRRIPDIADALAKMYHKENIKETEHGRELKTKEEKAVDIMKEIIAKSMKQIEKLKQRENLQNDHEEAAHSEEVSDNDDNDDEGDDADDDEDDESDDEGYDISEKTKNKIIKPKGNGVKMSINEAYDEQVGEDIHDDIGWDMDTNDDDNMDIEGSSTFEKINSFSKIKKHKKVDQSYYYEELIEHLKLQFRYLKKQLDSIINDMKKRIKLLEQGIGSVNPDVKALIDTTKKSVKSFENKRRVIEDAMQRLGDLYDAVMEDPDYINANEELASIRATLVGLVDKVNLKSEPLESNNDNNHDDTINENARQPYKPSEKIFKSEKKTQGFDMEKPNLDKEIPKLKKIMTREEDDDGDTESYGDDRIKVRVTKIKKKSEDLYDDNDLEKSLKEDNDENQLDELSENEEMREATKKLERMVRKQFQDAGINQEGKIKVKIVTSQESLQRVANGEEKFHIFTSQVKFRDLLSNLLGGTRQLAEEKRRQEAMEDNYNLVWGQDGFTSAPVSEKQSSLEREDNDESI